MPNFLRSVRFSAIWLMSFALSPLAAQLTFDQPVAGSANIYNLDRSAHIGGVEIHGTIDTAVARQAIELIKSIRPDVDELTVYLSSPGGDVRAAIELGQEIRGQWALTTVSDEGECLGACVLVLAAGVRRTPAPERVGLERLNLNQKDPDRERAKRKEAPLAKTVETYLARMGMPKKLFQEISQQSSAKPLLLSARQLKTLGLDGTDPAYEQWLRENSEQPEQSD
jgi:hypothetical protein